MDPKILTTQQRTDYLASGGQVCPFCGAQSSQEGGFVEVDGNLARQEVACVDCGENWVNIYTLSGIAPGDDSQWSLAQNPAVVVCEQEANRPGRAALARV